MERSPEQLTATTDFIERIILRAYEGTIRDSRELLENGPAGRKPAEEKVSLHQWFSQLAEDDREQVHRAVRNAVEAALFGVFVVLDGASGGWPIEGEISDFALYRQAYADYDAEKADAPKARVKINGLSMSEDLHDLFMLALQEREQRAGGSDIP
jgi:hypothetical protein